MNVKSSLWRVVAAALTSGVVLAGCGSGGDAAQADGETRTVQHELGEAEVPVSPETVVALDPYYSLPTALAAGANVVGSSHRQFGEPFPSYLDEFDTEGVENVGWFTELDIEKIMTLNPDVIVGLSSFVEADYEQLSKIAPTVAVSMDAMRWQETLGVIGDAIGKPDEVAASLADYQSQVEGLAGELDAAGLQEEPVSLLNIRAVDDLRVYTRSCSAAILGDLGLPVHLEDETEEGGNSVNLSIERLTDADAATMFYFVGSAGSNPEDVEAAYEEVSTHPLWERLEAVENDRAHQVNAEWWFDCGSVQAATRVLTDVSDLMLA